MHGEFIVFQRGHIHTQLTQQFHRRANVAQVRHIAQLHRIAGQQRRAHDRQCRVFRPANADVAFESQLSCTACDFELFHVDSCIVVMGYDRLMSVSSVLIYAFCAAHSLGV